MTSHSVARKERRPRYRFIPRAKGTSERQQEEWRARNNVHYTLEPATVTAYVEAIRSALKWDGETYNQITRRLSKTGFPIVSKANLRKAYLGLVEDGQAELDALVLRRLTLKPTRTLSGVAPVTVLTRPAPCPGKCIFCPDDVRMPKSYLSNEPGAMRALILDFDPYRQVQMRLQAMQNLGHATDKAEILILGGTWSSYPQEYREWFVRRCFDALNETESASIEESHQINENARHRNTGLAVETRPDHVTVDEVHHLRRLGVTRVQLGVQTLNDHVSELNRRGETSQDVRRAVRLLRGAGMKVAVHWMPNLLGATLQSDLEDFQRFWDDPALRPDEMKLYPTGLLRGTELYEHYARGEYRPYTASELTDLLMACKRMVPEYCRLNRVMRDIPAPEIADGVTTSNLRQIIQERLKATEQPCRCIRCREVKRELINPDKLTTRILPYDTDHSHELFISAVTPADKLAGFVRLSLPATPAPLEELDGEAIIRQVQVYGLALALGDAKAGRAQHQGIGSHLIREAQEQARQAGFERLAVIASAGTRNYYRRFGYELEQDYMHITLHA